MPHERRTIDHVTWWDYVRSVAGASASNAEIARMLDLSPSSVGRWQTSRPDPATAAAFARSYGRPVLEAFVAAGFLSAQEAGEQPTEHRLDLRALGNAELAQEVLRRMERGGSDAGQQAEAQKSPAEVGDVSVDFIPEGSEGQTIELLHESQQPQEPGQ